MGEYPRPLRSKERELLLSVLPAGRPGYRAAREFVETGSVLGEGRRGPGNLLLGTPPGPPDVTGPLPPVIAHGIVETTRGAITITVREPGHGQLDVELLTGGGEEIPDHFEEKRRWTYASWVPGEPSPATGASVREVPVGGGHTLAVCVAERRVWVHDGETGIVHPLPITHFYNMLMLHRRIRDPRIALQSSLFFEHADAYSDADLRAAFVATNESHPRVGIAADAAPSRRGLGGVFRRLFRGGSDSG